MLRTRLQIETRAEHEDLERAIPLMRPDLSTTEYVQILSRLFGFHKTVEEVLERLSPNKAAQFYLRDRRKLPLLENDLQYFSIDPTTLPVLPAEHLSYLADSQDAVWGLVYVLEGATLGGVVIMRHLISVLNPGTSAGFSYFGSRGASTGAMWRELLSQLENFEGDSDKVVTAAAQTFKKLKLWMSVQ